MTKAKPCAFCGGYNTYVYPRAVSLYVVACNDCLAEGPEASTEADAITAWSIRIRIRTPREAAMREALEAVRDHFDGIRSDKDWLETERLVRAALAAS
jgi:hypothetical protein